MSFDELTEHIEANYVVIADELYNAPKEKKLKLMGIE
jgi:hypothetical protein